MAVVEVLEKWLCASDPISAAAGEAMRGEWKMGGLRSVFWRVFLGLLTPPPTGSAPDSESDSDYDPVYEHWRSESDRTRSVFDKWRNSRQPQKKPEKTASPQANKKRAGPRFGDEDSDDSQEEQAEAADDNPLNATESSQWGKYFAKQKVMQLIDKDLGRLWSGVDFFEDDQLKANMREVLECLVDEGVVVDYCQGMHEVLSIVMMALVEDAAACDAVSATKPHFMALRAVCSRKYVCHDAFSITARILGSQDGGVGIAAWYEADPHNNEDKPVLKQADAIQGVLLRKLDSELADRLEKLDVQAAAYGLRWLRLLFIREFTLEQGAVVWDAIFAAHKLHPSDTLSRSVIPHIAVSMLVFVRNDLLEADYSLALRRLMRFPPVQSVSVIVQRACVSCYGPQSAVARLCGAPEPLHQPPEVEVMPGGSPVAPQAAATPQANTMPVQTLSASQRGNSPPLPPPLFDSPMPASSTNGRRNEQRERRLGERLATVIETMNTRWFGSSGSPPGSPQSGANDDDDESQNQYVLAIAELKQIRDALLSGLDA